MRRRRITWPLLLLCALALMGQSESDCGGGEGEPIEGESAGTEHGGGDDGASRQREELKAEGKYTVNCDYLLRFDESLSGNDNHKFVAGGTLENTGNVGIVVRVSARWQLLGAAPVRADKKVRIRRGREREAQLSVPATTEQIDAHQSADGDCKTNVKIVDSFGRPPLE